MSLRDLREISAGFQAAAPLTRPTVARTEPLRCPICGDPMQIERIHQIPVDVCPQHGIWFDRGEVAAFERRIKAGERLTTSEAVATARKEGKISGWWFGLFSLLVDDD
jgi:Zn-finger nucleic acid-binding protein